MATGAARLLVLAALLAALTAFVPATSAGAAERATGVGVPDTIPAPATGSEAIDCARSGDRLVLTRSAHLDPACDWAGVDIVASDVVLDCQGATVRGNAGRGIEVRSPVDVTMRDVVIRHCRTEGWLNGFRATRDGFRTLPAGGEYEHELADIVVEHSEIRNSVGVGLFVDGYVSRVTIRRSIVQGTGSAGIYLETGSRDNVVADNHIVDNGFRENGPGGQIIEFLGLRFRWWGTGREGVAVDGSYRNVISGNHFEGNSAGGVFLYKNCGEYPDSPRYFERRFGADDNVIEHNHFVGGVHGVWVGQRMGENTLPMECTDDAYVDEPLTRIVLDFARDNRVAHNTFDDVTYGVRVEDDGTEVQSNTFRADSADHHAVIVGTRVRTAELGRPVADTEIIANRADIAGNHHPYRWVHGTDGLRVLHNRAHGERVGVCEGEELPHLLFIFMIAFALEPPGAPETPPPSDITMPTVGELAPCADVAPPVVHPGVVTVVEGVDETAMVPVQLSGPADRTVVVRWRTRRLRGHAAQARPGADYRASRGRLEIDVGETAEVIEIPMLDDRRVEGDELLAVTVTDVRNGTIGGFYGSGFVVITDDD